MDQVHKLILRRKKKETQMGTYTNPIYIKLTNSKTQPAITTEVGPVVIFMGQKRLSSR